MKQRLPRPEQIGLAMMGQVEENDRGNSVEIRIGLGPYNRYNQHEWKEDERK